MEGQGISRSVRGRIKREILIEEATPYILAIFVNICFAGFNILTKVSLDQGMSCYVLLAYSNAFGTLASTPLALIFERKNVRKISLLVLRDALFLGFIGSVLGRVLYFVGLQYTSPIFASAMFNLLPSITFIFAVICRMEKMEISSNSSRAKVAGTIVAFSGAVLMTLYKGVTVVSMRSLIYSSHHSVSSSSKLSSNKNWIKGSLLLIISLISLSGFYVLQEKSLKRYSAPITLTSLMCLSGTLVSIIIVAILDHKANWRLSWNISLLGPLYNGVVVCAIITCVQLLVIQRRGPVFLTAFRPLSTIVVGIIQLFILGEALHMGSIVGTVLIVLGLYVTIWGKEKEIKEIKMQNPLDDTTA